MLEIYQNSLPLNVRIDKTVNSALDEDRLVGAVVMVSLGGRRVYQRAAGMMDRETAEPMRLDTIFRLASVTKPIVVTTALSLVQQGVIGLDDQVTQWLPDFQPRVGGHDRAVIRLRDLMNHTSGLGYRFQDKDDGPYTALDVSDGMDQPGLSLSENLERLAKAPLYFLPGTRWRYSLGIDVLGAVLTAATGKGLPELVQDHVTGPLNMRDTDFRVVDEARLAKAYANMPGGAEPMAATMEVPLYDGKVRFCPDRYRNTASYPSGGAGMNGTAHDVMTLLDVLRHGGGEQLQPQMAELMLAAHVGAEAQTQGPGWGFGFGGAVLLDPALAASPQSAGTVQWGGSYGHYWFIDRARELTVVALTNTAFEGMNGRFTRDLRDAIYG